MNLIRSTFVACTFGCIFFMLPGCKPNKNQKNSPPTASTTEERMLNNLCGGRDTSESILGIELGAQINAVEKILECYDKTAQIESGRYGTKAEEADRFLQEASSTGYSNLYVWTRGVPRACTDNATTSKELQSALEPDDKRYLGIIFSGAIGKAGFKCFSVVQDQLVILAEGIPGKQIVTGIWRTTIPGNGSRPKIRTLIEGLNKKYPILRESLNQESSNKFEQILAFGFTDKNNQIIDHSLVLKWASDSERPPAPEYPERSETCPNETECSTEEKNEYAERIKQYESKKREYDNVLNMVTYQAPCVQVNIFSDFYDRPISVDEPKECGASMLMIAKAYTGDLVEIFAISTYSHKLALQADKALTEHIKSYRGSIGREASRPAL